MTNLTAKMMKRYDENKASFKTYATQETANRTGERMSSLCVDYYGTERNGPKFITVYLPNASRWAVVVMLSDWLTSENTGGYLGFLAQKGIWTI